MGDGDGVHLNSSKADKWINQLIHFWWFHCDYFLKHKSTWSHTGTGILLLSAWKVKEPCLWYSSVLTPITASPGGWLGDVNKAAHGDPAGDWFRHLLLWPTQQFYAAASVPLGESVECGEPKLVSEPSFYWSQEIPLIDNRELAFPEVTNHVPALIWTSSFLTTQARYPA